MSILKPSVVVAGLVVALGAAVGLTSMGVTQVSKPKTLPEAGDAASKEAPADAAKSSAGKADRPTEKADKSDRSVHVEAPGTNVDVQKDTGRVRVKAPYTDVKVDPDKGQVRVRAPYVDLNIRW